MSTQLHSFLFTRVSLHFQMTRFYDSKIFIYLFDIFYLIFIYSFIYFIVIIIIIYIYFFWGGRGGGGGRGDCFVLFCFQC